jgi:hypothetical protein
MRTQLGILAYNDGNSWGYLLTAMGRVGGYLLTAMGRVGGYLLTASVTIQIHRIHRFMGHLDPDPDPFVGDMDPDPVPDPLITSKK